ncbi:DUF6308 family protein [Actinoplanes sp. ATCC 53533]|uniref:DUF6308 family protein n=1 Tax=Actinoplanes sp. ATCC 53533 TaxID=1288362 RepID=UPI001F20DB5A|nr:DUF6308 family protein [Actinoplanes sp. ATCC 53533]
MCCSRTLLSCISGSYASRHPETRASTRGAPGKRPENPSEDSRYPPCYHEKGRPSATPPGPPARSPCAVFNRYLAPGISLGKVSKVLHLKRPHLFPILDSRVTRAYRKPAEEAAALHPGRGHRRMYWAAVRNDVVAPANASALASLRGLLRGDADERVRQVAQLSDVRLLDILTWQP